MGRLRYWRRRWSVDHAPLLQSIYRFLEGWLVRLDPLWRRLGYSRLEMPFALTEKVVKGVLFDCQMCGQCALSQTGMSCPMNCPKSLRYGPCGGVRADGRCEVKPDMPCVWVEAWRGKQLLGDNDQALLPDVPVDFRLRGKSSWLREVQLRVKAQAEADKRVERSP